MSFAKRATVPMGTSLLLALAAGLVAFGQPPKGPGKSAPVTERSSSSTWPAKLPGVWRVNVTLVDGEGGWYQLTLSKEGAFSLAEYRLPSILERKETGTYAYENEVITCHVNDVTVRFTVLALSDDKLTLKFPQGGRINFERAPKEQRP